MVWPVVGRLLQIDGVALPFPEQNGLPVPRLVDSSPAVGLAAEPAVEQKEWWLGDRSLVANQAHSAIAAAQWRQAVVGDPTHLGWSPQTVTCPNPVPNGHLPETIHSSSPGFRVAAEESMVVGSVSARPKAQPVVAQAGEQKQESPQIATDATAFVHAGLVLLVLLPLAHRLVATHSQDRQPTEQRHRLLQAPELLDRSLGFLPQNQAPAHSPALLQQEGNPQGAAALV
jgi:hypothetical protein